MDKDEPGPERTCIVTRRKGAPETMIRFVMDPDGNVVADIRRKLPGRGVWVDAHETAVEQAVRKRAFARGFKAQATVPASLATDVGDLLARDALQGLAMANKAGAVTTGFAKVEAALAAGGVATLLHATDAGEDGVRKLDGATRRAHAATDSSVEPPPPLKVFSSQQLDLALGRTNVIHAALAVGPAGEAFLTRCRRLIQYRATPTHLEADAKTASV